MPHQKSHRAIRMIISDVDGTLVTPEKKLTEQTRQAILQLHRAGLKFTICSSRPPYGLHSIARNVQLNQPLVAFNGGMFIDPDGTVLHQHFLPMGLISTLLKLLEAHGVSPRLYLADRWLIQSTNHPRLQDEIATTETEPFVTPDFSPYFNCIFKLTGVSDDYEAMARCQNMIHNQLGEQLSALCSKPYYLDITHRLANKGHAVKMMARIQKVHTSEIAVIGDMAVDLPMFQAAGLSIAMGNAGDDVKRQAHYVTQPNTDEGFAKAMQNYILAGSVAL